MGRSIKCKPNNLCIAIFTFCLSLRFVEYFLIETDKTAIGENVLHKVIGIILLALAMPSRCRRPAKKSLPCVRHNTKNAGGMSNHSTGAASFLLPAVSVFLVLILGCHRYCRPGRTAVGIHRTLTLEYRIFIHNQALGTDIADNTSRGSHFSPAA